jgi:hypothetical protein
MFGVTLVVRQRRNAIMIGLARRALVGAAQFIERKFVG